MTVLRSGNLVGIYQLTKHIVNLNGGRTIAKVVENQGKLAAERVRVSLDFRFAGVDFDAACNNDLGSDARAVVVNLPQTIVVVASMNAVVGVSIFERFNRIASTCYASNLGKVYCIIGTLEREVVVVALGCGYPTDKRRTTVAGSSEGCKLDGDKVFPHELPPE